jgi:hypothetical protein
LKKWLQENLSTDGSLKPDDDITVRLMSRNLVTREAAYERVSIVLNKYNRKNTNETTPARIGSAVNSNNSRVSNFRDSIYSTNQYDFSDCDESQNNDDDLSIPSNTSPTASLVPFVLDKFLEVDLNLIVDNASLKDNGGSSRIFSRKETPSGANRDERSLSPRGKFNIGLTRARGTSESPVRFGSSPRLPNSNNENGERRAQIPSPRMRKISKSVDAADRNAYPNSLLAQQSLNNSDGLGVSKDDMAMLIGSASRPLLARKKATVGLATVPSGSGPMQK